MFNGPNLQSEKIKDLNEAACKSICCHYSGQFLLLFTVRIKLKPKYF